MSIDWKIILLKGGRAKEKASLNEASSNLARISLESGYMSCDIVNRVNLSCDGLNYSKSSCNHSTVWQHTHHHTHTLPRPGNLATCLACQNICSPLDPHLCDLFAHFCTPHSHPYTHTHTLPPHTLAEIVLCLERGGDGKKNIDDKHFRAALLLT